jgi:hypothetical protein
MRPWDNPRVTLAALIFVGYVAISRGVGHCFPFSIFDMYASGGASGSRVVARASDGRVVEIDRYRAWSCDAPIDLTGGETCSPPGSYISMTYKDMEAVDAIAANRGRDPAAVPVDVIRRIYWLSDRDPAVRIEDCTLARCRAVPR